MTEENLFHVQPLSRCNLTCDHCYVEHDSRSMGMEDVAAIPASVAFRCGLGASARLLWHGGEPTLKGVGWLAAAFEVVDEGALRYDLSLKNSLQTNLVFYSRELGSLAHRRLAGELRVAWDHAIRKVRVRGVPDNAAYEAAFTKNLDQAVKDGLAVDLIVAVTRPLAEGCRPEDLVARFEKAGVRSIVFERLLKIGRANENWDEIGVPDATFRAYAAATKEAAGNLGGAGILVAEAQGHPGRSFTIDASGVHSGMRFQESGQVA